MHHQVINLLRWALDFWKGLIYCVTLRVWFCAFVKNVLLYLLTLKQLSCKFPSSDRRFLRCLWRNEIHEYNRHKFGATDLLCAACYAVRQCGEDNKTVYSDAQNLVTRHIYMDDLYVSTNTLEQAKTLPRDLQAVLATGGSNLTKWTSNNSAPVWTNTRVIDRVLGVKWNPNGNANLEGQSALG